MGVAVFGSHGLSDLGCVGVVVTGSGSGCESQWVAVWISQGVRTQ